MPVEGFEISDVSVLKHVQCTSVPKVMIIAGPNGVGKSTLLEAITNVLRETRRGKIDVKTSNSPKPVYFPPHRAPSVVSLHKSLPILGSRRKYRETLGLQNFSIDDRLKSRISNVLRRRIAPTPQYDIDVVRVNKKWVTLIAIEEGDADLCTVNGAVFIRDVNGRTPASGPEITRLVKKRLGKKIVPAPTQREIVDSPYNLPTKTDRIESILTDFARVSPSYGFASLRPNSRIVCLTIRRRKWYFLVLAYGDHFRVHDFRGVKWSWGSPVSERSLEEYLKAGLIRRRTEVYPLILILGGISSLRTELAYFEYSVVPTRYGGYLGPGEKQTREAGLGGALGHIFMLSGITNKDVMRTRIETFLRWLRDNQQDLCKVCVPKSQR